MSKPTPAGTAHADNRQEEIDDRDEQQEEYSNEHNYQRQHALERNARRVYDEP
jgi:hypothetical protein